MPIRFEHATSPGGLRHLVMDVHGRIEVEDGRALEARLREGRAHHEGYVFARIATGTEYSPEVRRYLAAIRLTITAAAAVVTSPIGRAAISLMLRFAGRAINLQMFGTDEEAMAWLESHARSGR